MKKYPIAEMFASPQGEGLYAGTLMYFVRFAGCTVGKMFPKEQYKISNLPIYTEQCTLYDGRTFACDTDFRGKLKLTAQEILDTLPEGIKRICITGGEPLMHDLTEFLDLALANGLKIHLETSGTIPFDDFLKPFYEHGVRPYIAVSPKKDVLACCIHQADEIKLLIDDNFNINTVPPSVRDHGMVFIQPINHENTINTANKDRCLDLQTKYTEWRISSQAHKLWNVR